jgi:hypothetical protein
VNAEGPYRRVLGKNRFGDDGRWVMASRASGGQEQWFFMGANCRAVEKAFPFG